MNDLLKVFVGAVLGILIIGGVVMLFAQPAANVVNETSDASTNNGPITEVVQEKVNDFQESGSVDFTSPSNNTYTLSSSNASSSSVDQSNTQNNVVSSDSSSSSSSNSGNSGQSTDGSGVVGGQVAENTQEGGGHYYQIDYESGDFRQYDTETGELVGSSFDEDQEKLGVVNGDLV